MAGCLWKLVKVHGTIYERVCNIITTHIRAPQHACASPYRNTRNILSAF